MDELTYHAILNRLGLESASPKTSADWLSYWRELAQVTYGITADDPRFDSVMRWLNVCDFAFSLGSWDTFCEAAAEVKRIARRNMTNAEQEGVDAL